jgi:hypothetical protein
MAKRLLVNALGRPIYEHAKVTDAGPFVRFRARSLCQCLFLTLFFFKIRNGESLSLAKQVAGPSALFSVIPMRLKHWCGCRSSSGHAKDSRLWYILSGGGAFRGRRFRLRVGVHLDKTDGGAFPLPAALVAEPFSFQRTALIRTVGVASSPAGL